MSPQELDPDALAPREQMHAGTMEATRRFAAWIGMRPKMRVLDLGSGLGASARFMARDHGAAVTAVELCPTLHEAGLALTCKSGLDGLVRHVMADIVDAPPEIGAPFDLVWIQHVDMQVEDKPGMYAAIARFLAHGGRVVWHDWLAGPGGPPRWPVFWSEDGAISFLEEHSSFERLLSDAGLELSRFSPIPEETAAWFEKARRAVIAATSALSRKEPAPVERIARLEHLRLEMDNAIANTREARMIPFFGEAVARRQTPVGQRKISASSTVA